MLRRGLLHRSNCCNRQVAAFTLLLLALSAGTRAESLDGRDWPGAADPRHIRPNSFMAQLDYCRALARQGERGEILADCFRHAARLLDRGVRRRELSSETAGRTFEERLKSGAREIAASLEALPVDDGPRLSRELEDIEGQILSLRVELSRIAASEHVDLSLVSRGGVSLGNWQAGFLYSVTEWAKSRPGQERGKQAWEPAFSTVTGASAGAVNGLLAAVEGCRGPNPRPRDSLYYRVWINLGLFGRHQRTGLLAVQEPGESALALFSDQALEETLSEARGHILEERPLPSCSVDFGFVTTHLDRIASPIHVAKDGSPILTTNKLKEKFSVRLEFADGSSGDPVSAEDRLGITNIVPSGAFEGDRIYYAALGHEKRIPLEALLRGVQASAAFPGAFPPVPLTYTQYVPGPNQMVLARRRAGTFIDGGVLDNTPVGLAVSLDAWRNDSTAPDSALERLVPVAPRTYVFLEPGVRSWVHGSDEDASPGARERDLLKVFLGFTGDLLKTRMDAQLSNTAEQYSFVRRARDDWALPRLSVPRRHMPITGEQFYHFMAFLERDFRIFDFYVGMADAYEYLEGEECLYAGDEAACDGTGELHRFDASLQEADLLYRCVRAYYESDAFHVLRRIDTSQLPPECAALADTRCDTDPWQVSEESVEAFLKSERVVSEPEEDLCIEPAITSHNFRTLLAAMHNYKVWMQSDDYSEDRELDRFFDELGGEKRSQRFVYVDLPTYQRSDDGFLNAREVRQAFRSLMQDGIERLASEQDGFSKYALRLGGRAAADIAYERDYPRRIVGVGIAVNGFEGVFGQRLGRSTWRWDTTFRAFRIRKDTYNPDLDPWTSEFYLSTQATWILSPTKFVDLEVGAGWALSETIAYNSRSPGHIAFRTGPRSFLALVVIQRIYVGMNIDYYPVIETAPAYQDAFKPAVDTWSWNLSGGWRFLF